MLRRNRRRAANRRMGKRNILQLHRRDPLSAGLNDIFRPIVNHQVAILIKSANIAGIEPAVIGQRRIGTTIVICRHPMAAHLQIALTFAIVGQRLALRIHHPQIDAKNDASLTVPRFSCVSWVRALCLLSGVLMVPMGEVSVIPRHESAQYHNRGGRLQSSTAAAPTRRQKIV
jgi:hypothetical protein